MAEKFNCYLCKNETFSIVARQEQIRFNCYGFKKQVVRCLRCALVQLYPLWTNGELRDLYLKYSQISDFVGYKPKKSISYYLGRYLAKSDYVLEVGCGFGDNIKRLNKLGYRVAGIDKDPTVCDGKTVLNYDFKDFQPREKFDFIYTIHVFEHIADPRGFIKWMYDNLKEQGKFLLEIPSVDDPLLEIYNIDNFRNFYWYPYRLFFYNRDSIVKMFEEFYNIKIKIKFLQRYGLINHLRWLILKRPGNFNSHIPMLDNIYKYILTGIFKASDTLLVIGEKKF